MVDVVLVDENDNKVGLAEKLVAHEQGLLHRAISVYVFNNQGDILLQQRALSKYHSPGLWANTCCSHPFDGEDPLDAAHRRLQEEMGFVVELQPLAEFVYKVDVPTNLVEHEYLHVFVGKYNGEVINPDPEEVGGYQWISLAARIEELSKDHTILAPWTKVTWERLRETFLALV